MDIRLIAEPWDAAGRTSSDDRFPPRPASSGMAASGMTFGASCAVTPAWCRLSCNDSTAATISSRTTGCTRFILIRASTTLPLTTVSLCTTWFPTIANTTRPTATTTPMARTRTTAGTAAGKGTTEFRRSVMELRKRQAKNFCCLLMLANGTPMFRAGDEFLQTQGGNNNPYNQDNATSWLDWDRLRVNQDVFRFFRCMIAFRKAHPSLGRSRFWRDDVRWYGTGPTVDMGPRFPHFGRVPKRRLATDADLYLMINASTAIGLSRSKKVGPASGSSPSIPAAQSGRLS